MRRHGYGAAVKRLLIAICLLACCSGYAAGLSRSAADGALGALHDAGPELVKDLARPAIQAEGRALKNVVTIERVIAHDALRDLDAGLAAVDTLLEKHEASAREIVADASRLQASTAASVVRVEGHAKRDVVYALATLAVLVVLVVVGAGLVLFETRRYRGNRS